MGNAVFADYIIVWAKNREDKNQNLQGFVVEKGSPGMKIEKIKGKLSLRMTQNSEICFENVFVPSYNKLAKATNFERSCAPVLAKSRIVVSWGLV
jgi:alkylation response protein AidB-like acyl-CoA dehydrogenase